MTRLALMEAEAGVPAFAPLAYIRQEAIGEEGVRVRFLRGAFYDEVVGRAPRRPGAVVDIEVDGETKACRLVRDGVEQPCLDLGPQWRPEISSPLDLLDLGGHRGDIEGALMDEVWPRVAGHLDPAALAFADAAPALGATQRYNAACESERYRQMVGAFPGLARMVGLADAEGWLPGAMHDTDGLLAVAPGEVAGRLFAEARRRGRGLDPPVGVEAWPEAVGRHPALYRWLRSAPMEQDPRHALSLGEAVRVAAALVAAGGTGLDVNGLQKLEKAGPGAWRLFHVCATRSGTVAAAMLRDPDAAVRAVAVYGERGQAHADAAHGVEARAEAEHEGPRTLGAVPEATLRKVADDRARMELVVDALVRWQARPGVAATATVTAEERLERDAKLGFVRQCQEAEVWGQLCRTEEHLEIEAAREARRAARLRGEQRVQRGDPAPRRRAQVGEVVETVPFPTPAIPTELDVIADGRAFHMRWMRNGQDLRDESAVMGNCIGSFAYGYYAGRCLAGESICFSVLDAATGMRAATLELSSQVHIIQLEGSAIRDQRRAPAGLREAVTAVMAPYAEVARARAEELRQENEARMAEVRAANEVRLAEEREQAAARAAAEVAAREVRHAAAGELSGLFAWE